MSHGFELDGQGRPADAAVHGPLAPLHRLMGWINRLVLGISMLALLAAACVLTTSVFLRYFLKVPTDWQDEASVFLLVGATFMCGAYVQSQRGHIGIEALAGLLPAAVNRARLIFCDLASLVFCAFFSWKSWTLFHEAYTDGQTTSSAWAPPLALPYGLMAVGMTLLTLQILLQAVSAFSTFTPREMHE